MIDSTGLRIHVGTARKPPKQRAWRKLHIAVDRKTGTIVASELTASRARDATRVPALLTQIQAPLAWVAADSAYDKETVYKAIEAHSPGRRTRVVIPPQRNATLSQNSNTAMRERDRHIRAIERHGRREWYKLSGFTKRSMVENAVYRYKAIIGSEMRARTLARQRVEHRIGVRDTQQDGRARDARYVLRRVTQLPASGRSAICSGPCNNAGQSAGRGADCAHLRFRRPWFLRARPSWRRRAELVRLLAPLYTFLRSLEPVPSLKDLKGELRHYGQWNIDEGSVVSFAAIHFGTEELLPSGKPGH